MKEVVKWNEECRQTKMKNFTPLKTFSVMLGMKFFKLYVFTSSHKVLVRVNVMF